MPEMTPKATANPSANSRQITEPPPTGVVMSLAGVMACEVAASLLVALQRKPMAAIFFVVLGVTIALDCLRRHRRRADAIAANQIQTATRLLAAGNHAAAWEAADAAARVAAGTRQLDAALTIMVRVAIGEALRGSEGGPGANARARGRRSLSEAAVERADGRAPRPETLERARGRQTFDPAAARLLVELYAEANQLDQAVQIAITHLDLLEVHDVRNMIASLEAWDEPRHAAALVMALTIRGALAERQIRLS